MASTIFLSIVILFWNPLQCSSQSKRLPSVLSENNLTSPSLVIVKIITDEGDYGYDMNKSRSKPLLSKQLFHPLLKDDFISTYLERRTLIISRNCPGYFDNYFSIGDIDDVLLSMSTAPSMNTATIAYATTAALKPETIIRGHGIDWKLIKRRYSRGDWWSSSLNFTEIPYKTIRSAFSRGGFSVVINALNRGNKSKRMHILAKEISQMLPSVGYRININLYMTPAEDKQAFEAHFDWMDGLILQVSASSKWSL